MSRPAALALLVALSAGGLGACREAPKERKLPAFAGALPIAALDALAGEHPVEVSLSGYVAMPPARQDDPEGAVLVLDDGTGRARIEVPDTSAAALPVGARFLVQGLLHRTDAGVFVAAEEWLYDSTAAPVRSPQP